MDIKSALLILYSTNTTEMIGSRLQMIHSENMQWMLSFALRPPMEHRVVGSDSKPEEETHLFFTEMFVIAQISYYTHSHRVFTLGWTQQFRELSTTKYLNSWWCNGKCISFGISLTILKLKHWQVLRSHGVADI